MARNQPRRIFQRDRKLQANVLEKGMTGRQYNALKREWDAKLADSGFFDIEFTNKLGQTSEYFRDYPTFALGQRYNQSTLDYYLLAATFRDKADWRSIAPQQLDKLYKFIWTQHCEGVELAGIEKAVKRRASRHGKKRTRYGQSIFTIHGIVHKIKELFLAKLRSDPDWFNEV